MKLASTPKIAFIGIMTAVAASLSLLTSAIPNFSVILAFFLILIDFSGFKLGSLVMLLTITISALRVGGFGIWSIFQWLAYLIIFGFWYLLTSQKFGRFLWLRTLLAAILGYSFGFWNALFNVPFYHIPNFWIYYFQGIYFDVSLCVATGISYYLMKRFIYPILTRYASQFIR